MAGKVIFGGFAGYAIVADEQVLATGGSLSKSQEPIISSGVAAFGIGDVTNAAYAKNYRRYDGSVSYDLIAEGFAVASIVKAAASGNFTLSNGTTSWSGAGVVTECSYAASMDANVTGDVSFMGPAEGSGVVASPAKLVGEICVPYWRTSTGWGDTTDWNCSISRAYTAVKCLKKDTTVPDGPDYYVAGLMEGSGSATLLTNGDNGSGNTLNLIDDTTAVFNIGNHHIKYTTIVMNSVAFDIVGAGDNRVVTLDFVTIGSAVDAIVIS